MFLDNRSTCQAAGGVAGPHGHSLKPLLSRPPQKELLLLTSSVINLTRTLHFFLKGVRNKWTLERRKEKDYEENFLCLTCNQHTEYHVIVVEKKSKDKIILKTSEAFNARKQNILAVLE